MASATLLLLTTGIHSYSLPNRSAQLNHHEHISEGGGRHQFSLELDGCHPFEEELGGQHQFLSKELGLGGWDSFVSVGGWWSVPILSVIQWLVPILSGMGDRQHQFSVSLGVC